MDWTPLVIAVLFLAPLHAMGELGVWSFEEPRSHLRWDEATGADAPQAGDEPGGGAALWSRLAVGALAVAGLAWIGRRSG